MNTFLQIKLAYASKIYKGQANILGIQRTQKGNYHDLKQSNLTPHPQKPKRKNRTNKLTNVQKDPHSKPNEQL